MSRKLKISFLGFLVLGVLHFGGCSSGEYVQNQYRFDYIEETIKADTIRNVAIKEDNTKEDRIKEDKFLTRESYAFAVQIGAFANPDYFARFLQMAKMKLSDDVYYDLIGSMYRVRIGAFTNRAEALKYIEFVRAKGYLDAFIITKKR